MAPLFWDSSTHGTIILEQLYMAFYFGTALHDTSAPHCSAASL
jgi:hypothetical protein